MQINKSAPVGAVQNNADPNSDHEPNHSDTSSSYDEAVECRPLIQTEYSL